jgi:hypothetical protein
MTSRSRSDRHPSPPLGVLAAIFTVLFLAGLVVMLLTAGGDHFPNPFADPSKAAAYFREHALAVQWGGFLQFCAAIPLGLFAASSSSRLRFLGIKAAGATIALYGGLVASCLLALSGLSAWVLSQPGVDGAAARALHLLAFGLGGPGHVATLGLLVAGLAVSSGLGGLLARGWMWSGIAIAAASELSVFSLVFLPAALFLPLGRFTAMVWLIAVGFLLPHSLAEAEDARSESETRSGARPVPHAP